MRRAALIFMLGLSLTACSVSDITSLIAGTPTPPPTGIPTETVYVTSTSTPSITPTQPTPTFTTTPTLVYSGPTATASATPLPTSTLWKLSPGSNPLTPEQYGFISYSMDGNILHWGICPPNKIHATARPTEIVRTHFVLLFLRLQDKQYPFEATHWGSGAIMDSDGKGTFTYTLSAENLPGYRDYTQAWVQYQFVALDKDRIPIGRSKVILNNIAYSPCK